MIMAKKLFLTGLFFAVVSKVGGESLEEADLREYSGLKFAPVSGIVLKKNTDGKVVEKNNYYIICNVELIIIITPIGIIISPTCFEI